MKWTDQEPDARVNALRPWLRQMDCASAVRLLMNRHHGVRLYVTPGCAGDVASHVASDRNEVGGLLLGHVWGAGTTLHAIGHDPIVWVTESLASEVFRNSSTSLEMDTEIWDRARERGPELLVVGWYHSHPDLGAFFSGTDRQTQRAFFTQPYSIGWVIDPFRREERVFMGGDSREYSAPLAIAPVPCPLTAAHLTPGHP